MNYVYTLHDPRNLQIRYVGFTTTSLEKRYKGHLYAASIGNKCRVYNWIRSLSDYGVKPVMTLLEEGDFDISREVFWIAKFRETGYDLVNVSAGGEGFGVLTDEKRKRFSEAFIGRVQTPEQRANTSRIMKELYSTPEAKQKRSEMLKRTRNTPEYHARASALRKGKKQSPEWVDARREGRKRSDPNYLKEKPVCLECGNRKREVRFHGYCWSCARDYILIPYAQFLYKDHTYIQISKRLGYPACTVRIWANPNLDVRPTLMNG